LYCRVEHRFERNASFADSIKNVAFTNGFPRFHPQPRGTDHGCNKKQFVSDTASRQLPF